MSVAPDEQRLDLVARSDAIYDGVAKTLERQDNGSGKIHAVIRIFGGYHALDTVDSRRNL